MTYRRASNTHQYQYCPNIFSPTKISLYLLHILIAKLKKFPRELGVQRRFVCRTHYLYFLFVCHSFATVVASRIHQAY